MTPIQVDTLRFEFPDSWTVSKYDEWSFYRNQFCRTESFRSVDLLAIDPEKTAWFIEVKDYRVHPRTKPSSVGEEFACKVFDTLTAILPARVNGRDPDEVELARAVLSAKKLRAVLHLEQPAKHSTLRPRAIDPAAVLQEIRRRLKAVDPHVYVAEISRMGALAWSVA
jgi:hypothetical protein